MAEPNKYKLSVAEIEQAALAIGIETAAMRAVAEVESSGDGFLADGRCKILFEAHLFSANTNHAYDKSHPHISSRKWNRKLYGASGAHQWDRLTEAMLLDREAALKSASYGAFQILGSNHKACGFETVECYFTAMMEGAAAQLKAFTKFLESEDLIVFLKAKNWAGFARRYNGASFALNKYDLKLEKAYEKYSK